MRAQIKTQNSTHSVVKPNIQRTSWNTQKNHMSQTEHPKSFTRHCKRYINTFFNVKHSVKRNGNRNGKIQRDWKNESGMFCVVKLNINAAMCPNAISHKIPITSNNNNNNNKPS